MNDDLIKLERMSGQSLAELFEDWRRYYSGHIWNYKKPEGPSQEDTWNEIENRLNHYDKLIKEKEYGF